MRRWFRFPVRVICCGEFEAAPVTVKVAVSAAVVLGVKVTLMLQRCSPLKSRDWQGNCLKQ